MRAFIGLFLFLILVLTSTASGQRPILGVYTFPDSTFAAFGLWDDKPFVTFSNGDIHGLRRANSGNLWEMGSTLGLFDDMAGTIHQRDGRLIELIRKDDPPKIGTITNFTRKEYRFRNGDVNLSGTLILPPGPGPFPCIVLTHGSGPEKREAGYGMAFLFASNGVASFVYDKRYVHDKDEKRFEDTFDHYAEDAIAAAKALMQNKSIDPKSIGIYGHSQGGWVAPLAVSKSDLFSFLIISAANAVSPVEQHLYYGECLGRHNGVPEHVIREIKEFRYIKYEAGITGNMQKFDSAVVVARTRPWFWRTGEQLPGGRFWKLNGYYDPMPALMKIKIPVLMLAGALDRYSDTARNMALFRRIFETNGNTDVTYKVFPNANHALLETSTGKPDEVELPELKRFAEGYFEFLGSWLRAKAHP